LREVLDTHKESQIPATPTRENATLEQDEADPLPACPACGSTLELVATDAEDLQGDYYLVDDEAFCRYCNERVEELDDN